MDCCYSTLSGGGEDWTGGEIGGRAASQARLAGEEAGAHDSRLDWVVVVNSSSMGKVKGGGDD